MASFPRGLRLLIVGSSPIYTSALQGVIAGSLRDEGSEIVRASDGAPAALDPVPDVALLAPRDWRELGAWIAPLQKQLPFTPWCILADLRVVGLFLQDLGAQPCVLVDPNAAMDDLFTELQAAASHHFCHLPTVFFSRIRPSLGRQPGAPTGRMPSSIELAIGCGISLGLSNQELAEALHLSEATTKNYLHRLMCRMGLHRRAELGALISKALVDPPPAPKLERLTSAR